MIIPFIYAYIHTGVRRLRRLRPSIRWGHAVSKFKARGSSQRAKAYIHTRLINPYYVMLATARKSSSDEKNVSRARIGNVHIHLHNQTARVRRSSSVRPTLISCSGQKPSSHLHILPPALETRADQSSECIIIARSILHTMLLSIAICGIANAA